MARGYLIGATGLILAGAVALAAPPKRDDPMPATGAFRCFDGALCPDDDGVIGDESAGYGYYVSMKSKGTTVTAGSFLAGSGNGSYNLRVLPGTPGPGDNRYLRIDRGAPTGGFPCQSTGNCNPVSLPPGAMDLHDVHLIAKPLVPGTEVDLPGGLLAMPCSGAIHDAVVQFTFPYPGTSGHWGLNFNPRGPAVTSTFASIERSGQRAWRLFTTADDRAGLLGFAHDGIKGNTGPSQEGTYVVPFELSVTVPETTSVPACS